MALQPSGDLALSHGEALLRRWLSLIVRFNPNVKMSDSEIKPSFSPKYLSLIVVTAVIAATATALVNKIYESREVRQLAYDLGSDYHEIRGEPLFGEQIVAEYHLKAAPETRLKTLIRKQVRVENTGTKSAEDILFSAAIKEDGAMLVDKPGISTVPKEIVDGILVKKTAASDNKKHVWTISLLNPGESILFDYGIYSEAEVKAASLTVAVRKADWQIVSKSDLLSKKQSKTPLAINILLGALAGLAGVFPAVFIWYAISWMARPKLQTKYLTFWQFWLHGEPKDLSGIPRQLRREQNDAANGS